MTQERKLKMSTIKEKFAFFFTQIKSSQICRKYILKFQVLKLNIEFYLESILQLANDHFYQHQCVLLIRFLEVFSY